jgi:hypothetical protein
VSRFTLIAGVVVALLGTLPAARGEDAKQWGTLKGRVVWGGGDVPQRKPLNVDKDMGHCLSKGPLLSEEWVVNPKNKGVQWTFVWLDVEPKSKDRLPVHPNLQKIQQPNVTIDQPTCMFEPHCLGLRQGQNLVVKNSAPIPHNVNWAGNPLKNPGGNVLVPAGGQFVIQDLKADRFPLQVTCNIHPWMKARVGVFDHPYFAVTDADGNFEIKDAPAGNYRLKVYHESIGWRNGAAGKDGEKTAVKPGAVTDLGSLEIAPPK